MICDKKISVCLLKGRTTWLYSLWDTYGTGGFEVSWEMLWWKRSAYFHSRRSMNFKGERYHQSHAAAFSWTGWTRGQFLKAKSWVSSFFAILPDSVITTRSQNSVFVHTSGCQQHYLTLSDLSVFVPKSHLLYGIIIACTNQLQVLHIIFPLKGVCMN